MFQRLVNQTKQEHKFWCYRDAASVSATKYVVFPDRSLLVFLTKVNNQSVSSFSLSCHKFYISHIWPGRRVDPTLFMYL